MAVLMLALSIPMGAAQVGLVSTDILIEGAQADGDRRASSVSSAMTVCRQQKSQARQTPFGADFGFGTIASRR